jgi:hypothetical protein
VDDVCAFVPAGAVPVSGTSLVPPDSVTLSESDCIDITVGGLGTLSYVATAVGRCSDLRRHFDVQ